MTFTNKDLHNGQAIYRMSLAMSDLLVGIVVFPTFISTLHLSLHKRPGLEDSYHILNCSSTCDGNNTSMNSLGEIHLPQYYFPDVPQPYYDAIGVFTSLSLIVSLYTLVAAAIDRFWAIHRGLEYIPSTALTLARRVVTVIWIFAIFFSVLPLLRQTKSYNLAYAVLIGAIGRVYATIYSVILFLPLLLMWCITTATFISYKLYANKRKKLRMTHHNKMETAIQIHLLVTLSIMVWVFTICILPGAIFVLIQSLQRLSGGVLKILLTLGQRRLTQFVSAEIVTSIFLTSNSLWNFFIYSVRDKKFRQASKKLYCRLLRCGKSK